MMTETFGQKKYQAYLTSGEWAAKRDRILRRDRNRCCQCGQRADHVHHKTYEHIFCERDDDLVSLCAECHALEHGRAEETDRQRWRQEQHNESELRKLYR